MRPTVEVDRLPLRPLALVALLLAAKMLLGRVTPSRVQTPSRAALDYLDEDS